MSAHPNVVLMAALTPQGLTRATYRAILSEAGLQDDDCPELELGDEDYNFAVMESGYLDDYQLASKEGDILVFALVTYGYGEAVTWEKLLKLHQQLEAWCLGICAKHHCTYEIRVGANYW